MSEPGDARRAAAAGRVDGRAPIAAFAAARHPRSIPKPVRVGPGAGHSGVFGPLKESIV